MQSDLLVATLCQTLSLFDNTIFLKSLTDPFAGLAGDSLHVTGVVNLTRFLHESGRRGGVNFSPFWFSANS